MKIKKLEKCDIKKALDLVGTVFQEFVAPDLSVQGIEEFKKFTSYNSIIQKFDKEDLYFWGCMDKDSLSGVIATKGINHICMLFVKKEYHRRGIARILFQTVEKNCREQKNITVNSSPYALKFYRNLGFADTDSEQTANGIRFIPMVYSLK